MPLMFCLTKYTSAVMVPTPVIPASTTRNMANPNRTMIGVDRDHEVNRVNKDHSSIGLMLRLMK